jgi:hypothetical protein
MLFTETSEELDLGVIEVGAFDLAFPSHTIESRQMLAREEVGDGSS